MPTVEQLKVVSSVELIQVVTVGSNNIVVPISVGSRGQQGPTGPAGSGTDNNAIHDNVAGEIQAIATKTTPVVGDLLIIEDSEDSFNKKKIGVNPLDSGTVKPTVGSNGSVFTAQISSDGRLYFWANGVRYYVSGIADPIGGGGSGQPLGPFWWLVYAQS
jgi:hypothetical protein